MILVAEQNPTLWIREIARFPEQGPEDRLQFEPGVNILVGVPNTGKSKWLRIIDYLLGDDNKPDEAFGEDVAAKYDSARAVVVVGNEEWVVERRWKEDGLVTKTSVNGEWMTLHAFTLKLMGALAIPVVHYPQGNPYSPRGWPELGWRSLYRHAYRRQLLWGDIADRQFESEQHACLLQFVGIAEVLFSEEYGRLVALEKKIQQLQSQREQFVSMLQEVSRELIDDKELGVALTPDSIEAAIRRQEAEIAAVQQRRQTALHALLEGTTDGSGDGKEARPQKGVVEELGEELASLRSVECNSTIATRKTAERVAELRTHRALIAEELGRMQRAVEAGSLLADLKITHCPACDRPIGVLHSQEDQCYLCKRPTDSLTNSAAAERRLAFEVDQLKAELGETDQLLGVLVKESERLQAERLRAEENIARIETRLQPIRSAAASMLPPELAVFDQDTGRLQERTAQLRRIRSTLEKREAIAADIQKIQGDVAALEAELAEQSKRVSFENASDLLGDGMNTYLNAINEIKPKSWTQQEVDFMLRDRNFSIRIGKGSWRSKLGGTLTLFFLIGYHYALMALTGKKGCHYPGFCVLDFPAQLDGVKVSDTENFVLEPFVRMMEQPGQPVRQVIAAGSSFAGLKGANRIEFSTVWD